jgi:ferrochelatase
MSYGVLLFNLGGPETLADVRPFLFNLFSDPDIIRIRNGVARRTLAWLIATLRQNTSRNLYRQIGGGSPLRRITEAQARALEERLAAQNCPARVYVGMRCWKPTIDEAVSRIAADGVRHLVLLPLFPQFSVTTTGSCFHYFRTLASQALPSDRVGCTFVESWYEEPLYLDAMADLILETGGRFSTGNPAEIQLLFSAHSIPARYVDEGDPYLAQTQKTVELINQKLAGRHPSTLAFQSKVGPVKWLGPATPAVLTEFGKRGVRRVLPVPISFVSDHIETLQEIDILYRDLAARVGIEEFHRAPSLNTHPKFIDALAKITLKSLGRSHQKGC